MTPDQWRAFRLVRGTYGQRQADDAQMLRVKIPQGMLTERPARRARRRRRALLARLRPHHDAAERAVPLRQAARRRAGDAAARRGGPDDARGVRQLGAQHHRVPVRRRRRRRALRRDAVRRGADALSCCAIRSARRCRASSRSRSKAARAITSSTGDQRSRLPRACSGRDGGRGFRVTAGGGTAIMCEVGGRAARVPAGRPRSSASPRRCCACSSALGDYEHKQRNRMKFMIKTLGWDALARGVRPRADRVPPARRRCRRSRSIRRRPSRSPTGCRTSSPSVGHIAARVAGGPRSRARAHADDRAGASSRRRGVRAVARDQRPAAEAVRLRDGDRRPCRSAISRASRCACSASWRARTATAPSASRPIRICVFRWVNVGDVRELYRRLAAAGLGLAEAGTVADVTSCPGAESCRLAVTQSRGLGRLLEDHLRARPDLDRRGRRRAHQDQRLPERLRPASHRDDRVPGQRAAARRRAPCRSTS